MRTLLCQMVLHARTKKIFKNRTVTGSTQLAIKLGYFVFVFQIFWPSSIQASASLNFAQLGISMHATLNGDQNWSTTGGAAPISHPPAIVQKANSVRLAFPLTGWDYQDPQSGWKISPWLGHYESKYAPWVYHHALGWLYLVQHSVDSIWFWQEEMGWNWTSHTLFPYFHQNTPAAWLRFNPESTQPALVYDFINAVWFEVGRRLISVQVTIPEYTGGGVEGRLRFRQGEDLLLYAKPNPGFVFNGWKGDFNTGENPLLRTGISRDINLSAHFSSILT